MSRIAELREAQASVTARLQGLVDVAPADFDKEAAEAAQTELRNVTAQLKLAESLPESKEAEAKAQDAEVQDRVLNQNADRANRTRDESEARLMEGYASIGRWAMVNASVSADKVWAPDDRDRRFLSIARSKDNPAAKTIGFISGAQLDVLNLSTSSGLDESIPDETVLGDMFFEKLKYFGPMRQVADVKTFPNGHKRKIPYWNDTANLGRILGEGANRPDGTDPTDGSRDWEPDLIHSLPLPLTIEGEDDTLIPMIGQRIFNAIVKRIGRFENQVFTRAVKGTQLSANTAATKETTGLAGSITRSTNSGAADAVGPVPFIRWMENALDPAYMGPQVKLMMTQHARTYLMTQTIENDVHRFVFEQQPLQMRIAESGKDARALRGSMVSGYIGTHEVILNNDMPEAASAAGVLTANADFAYIGDFSEYCIADVAGYPRLDRFWDSRTAQTGKVEFHAFTRTGGFLLDTDAVAKLVVAA